MKSAAELLGGYSSWVSQQGECGLHSPGPKNQQNPVFQVSEHTTHQFLSILRSRDKRQVFYKANIAYIFMN
jgi:hypothetical protein